MKSTNLLSTALKVNALFSSISGIALIVFHQYWLRIFEVNFQFYILGVGLLFFAWQVFKIAKQKPISIKAAKSVVIMDLFWVLMSAVVLLANDSISPAGNWLIGIVAAFVADFALFQMIGIRNLLRTADSVQHP